MHPFVTAETVGLKRPLFSYRTRLFTFQFVIGLTGVPRVLFRPLFDPFPAGVPGRAIRAFAHGPACLRALEVSL